MRLLDVVTSDTMDIEDPTVRVMFAQIESAYKCLVDLLDGMTVGDIDYRGPDGTLNSISMLVHHLADIDIWYRFALAGEQVPEELTAKYYAEESDGRIKQVSGKTAQELREHYFPVHLMLKEVVKTMTADDLERRVQLRPDLEITVRWALWHLAEHSMMHQGQMRWLKAWSRR